MKTILLLLLTCLPLCAATTYPMLSTTTNRTVTGGVTNLSFLNSNSVFTGTARWMGIATLTNTGNIFVGDGSGLTGVGMVTSGGLATNATIYGLTVATGQTNTHLTASSIVTTDANNGIVSGTTTADLATLSANQTFTGTNTFPAASFYTANNIARRMLWRTNDIFIASATVHADNMTNNGDFALATSVFNVLLPPLLGSNSVVVMGYSTMRTNLNSTIAYLGVYAGTNTNWMNSIAVGASSSIGNAANAANIVVFQNNNSFTSQYQAPSVSGPQFNGGSPITIANTAASWNIYGGIYTVTSFTNLFLRSLWFEEIVIP